MTLITYGPSLQVNTLKVRAMFWEYGPSLQVNTLKVRAMFWECEMTAFCMRIIIIIIIINPGIMS